MTTFPTIANPSIQTPTTVKDPALKSDLINGMQVSRARYTRVLRKWALKWNALADTDLQTLLTFYDTVKGGSASFTWADEFGNNYTVRFDSEINHESVAESLSSASFDLAEV
jgi:hypothetical protein